MANIDTIFIAMSVNGNTYAGAPITAAGIAGVTGLDIADVNTELAVYALPLAQADANTPIVDAEDGSYYLNENYAGTIGQTPGGAGSTPEDTDALAAMSAVICAAGAGCMNDVDVTLGVTGHTKPQWQRGNANIQAVIDLLRCQGLRDKLQAAGLDLVKLDGMLNSADVAMVINRAMYTHEGQPGV